MTSKKQYTLTFLRSGDRLLLGLKKRGFGVGRFNGFGGKVNPDEDIVDAAIRELEEECGAVVIPENLRKVGVIDFEFQGEPVIMEVHIFITETFTGTICESDEMRPQWFSASDLPYELMWPDDKIWCPKMLAGETFNGYFLFKGHDIILESRLEPITVQY